MHPFRVVSQTWIAIFGNEKRQKGQWITSWNLNVLLEGLKHDDDDFKKNMVKVEGNVWL